MRIFKIEKLQDIYDEILPLLIEHYKEVAPYLDIKFEPDVAAYFKLEDEGVLKVFTAREDEVLIGYNAFFIRKNLHYKNTLNAANDVIFIKKEKRGFGRDFIAWCDVELRKMGVQVVSHHIKKLHNWGNILEDQDYELVDLVYLKRLDREK